MVLCQSVNEISVRSHDRFFGNVAIFVLISFSDQRLSIEGALDLQRQLNVHHVTLHPLGTVEHRARLFIDPTETTSDPLTVSLSCLAKLEVVEQVDCSLGIFPRCFMVSACLKFLELCHKGEQEGIPLCSNVGGIKWVF